MARPPQERLDYWHDVAAAYGYLLYQPQRIEAGYSLAPFYRHRASYSWDQGPDSRLSADHIEASRVRNRSLLGRTTVSHHLSLAFHLGQENVALTDIAVDVGAETITGVTSQMLPSGKYVGGERADDLFSRARDYEALAVEPTDEHYDLLRRHLIGGVVQKATFVLELIEGEDH